MTPFVAPVLPCRACGAVERPMLTHGPGHTSVAHCAACGARIKALPSLTQLPLASCRLPAPPDDIGHPVLLAQRCRHCHSITIPRVVPGRGPHAGAAVCSDCGGFLR